MVIASRRLVEQKVWQTSQYEFEDVIAKVDDVAWCSPEPVPAGPTGRLARGMLNRAGRRVGRPRRAAMAPPREPSEGVDADLLFATFGDATEIGMLPHIQPQVRRAAARVAWIMELWTPQLPRVTDYLRQLGDFDHVFVANRSVAAAVAEITGVPCSYLPGAANTATYAPAGPDSPARTVDVATYGRRLPGTHAPLLQALTEGRLNYVYDTVRGAWDVTGHAEHRIAQAALLQRSRYSIVYKINDEPSRVDRTGSEESLTNRYFESLAAGTVLLGSAPDSEEWADCFPWPDAIIAIPAPAPDIVSIIAELDRDPARLARARVAAVTAFLRRHDWAHRWQQVLAVVGMDEAPQLTAHLAQLRERADAWERNS